MAPVDTFNEWRGQWVQDAELTRIYMDGIAGKELTEIEQARFDNLCVSEYWTHLKIHEWTIATDDTATNAGHLEMVRAGLEQSPGLRKCWNRVKNEMRVYGADSFIDGIENTQ